MCEMNFYGLLIICYQLDHLVLFAIFDFYYHFNTGSFNPYLHVVIQTDYLSFNETEKNFIIFVNIN